jgi:hypothetical protein
MVGHHPIKVYKDETSLQMGETANEQAYSKVMWICVCESRSACKSWLRALIEGRLTSNRALFRANIMVVSASEEMIGHVHTGSDCGPLSRLSRAKAEVDQLSNAGMSID